MMKIIIAAMLWLIAVDAYAQTRVETTGMTCAQIRSALDRNGTAILRYRPTRNPGFVTSGTYVRDGRYCGIGQTAQPASLPAADTGRCFVQRCMTNARSR
jgi:hypothetical protein